MPADPNFVYNSGCNTIYNEGQSVRAATLTAGLWQDGLVWLMPYSFLRSRLGDIMLL